MTDGITGVIPWSVFLRNLGSGSGGHTPGKHTSCCPQQGLLSPLSSRSPEEPAKQQQQQPRKLRWPGISSGGSFFLFLSLFSEIGIWSQSESWLAEFPPQCSANVSEFILARRGQHNKEIYICPALHPEEFINHELYSSLKAVLLQITQKLKKNVSYEMKKRWQWGGGAFYMWEREERGSKLIGKRKTQSQLAHERKRAKLYQAQVSSSLIFLDIERAAGPPDSEMPSLSAVTGWSESRAGGPGSFQSFMMPEGDIDTVAAAQSHQMKIKKSNSWEKKQSPTDVLTLNSRELHKTSLAETLANFIQYVERVKETAKKPLVLIAHFHWLIQSSSRSKSKQYWRHGRKEAKDTLH